MARATGIQITETGVRVAEVDGSPKGFRILGAAEAPLDTVEGARPDQQALGEAVRHALREIKAKREFLVLGLPAREATIREIVVPFTDPEQIKKVIKFECEANLPTTDIDEVIVGWYKISETGPRSRLLIFAIEKGSIKHYLEALARVGIEPGQVDLDCAALFSWSRLQKPFQDATDDPRAHVILDLGETTSTILITRAGRLRFVRSVRIGSDSIARSLSTDLGIERDEARRITRSSMEGEVLPFATAGELAPQSPSTALSATALRQDIVKDRHAEFARRIVNEVRRSLSSVQIEGGLGGIHLTGPASASTVLERGLRDGFNVDVTHLDALADASSDLTSAQGLWVPAPIGLALKSMEHDPVGLEFRQEEFTFARKFERLRVPLLVLAMSTLMLFGFLNIKELNRLRNFSSDINALAARADQQYLELVVGTAETRKIHEIMGYQTAELANEQFETLRRAKAEERIRGYLKYLQGEDGPVAFMRANYGVLAGEDSSEPPPETITTSALVRHDQFLGCIAKVADQIKPFTVDKLRVSSTTVSWNMKATHPDSFALLLAEFEKLEGYDRSQPATPGQLRQRGEFTEYTSCTLNFVREDR